MAAHQHRDVASRQRLLTDADALGLADQPRDLGRTGTGRSVAGLLLGQRLVLRIARQSPELQCSPGGPGLVEQQLARFVAIAHRQEVQSGQHERALVGAEQGVQGVQQRLARALVLAQGVLGGGLVARLQVGRQVGVAKAVDRLFRVTDQEQRAAGVAIDRAEDRELQRVSVLELVDQRRRKPSPQRCRQARALGQALVQIEQHVVKRDHPARPLGLAQFDRALSQQVAQQAQTVQRQRLRSRLAQREQG